MAPACGEPKQVVEDGAVNKLVEPHNGGLHPPHKPRTYPLLQILKILYRGEKNVITCDTVS